MRRILDLSVASDFLLLRESPRSFSSSGTVERPCPAAVDQPGGGRKWLLSSFLFECSKIKLSYCPSLIKSVELEGHAMSSKLSQSMKDLEKTGTAGRIRCDGEVRSVAENLPSQASEDIARSDLNEDTSTRTIHCLYFICELDRTD